MHDPPDRLQELREQIEAVDRHLLGLLRKRQDLATEVADVKLDRALPFRDAAREDQVLSHIRHLASERGLDPHEVERLYRILMEMSIACQQSRVRSLDETPLRVAYQGVEGSYSHLAGQRRYAGRPGGALLIGCSSFQEVAESVRNGETDYGLLPIENTTAGSINETYDLLAEGDLKIVGEALCQIIHCLLGLPGTDPSRIRSILSHPQAISQCRTFLSRFPDAKAIAEYDTAGAAQKVRDLADPTLAAIAGEEAARLYGLEILERGINTDATNLTRFVEIGRESEACPAGASIKTSLILELAHRPGALIEALRVFGNRQINLLKLESRPLPGRPFEYRFYLDIAGHVSVPPVSEALQLLQGQGTSVMSLGSYPVGME
jgi:chorismate mutase/prephenate dehydratase